MFIILEGIEGSGKSTQARFLSRRLRKEGYDVVLTKEPGGEGVRRLIRRAIFKTDDPWSELFLFWADRRLHYVQIKAWLAEKKIVISDRSFPSTYAYQYMVRGLARRIPKRVQQFFENIALGNIRPNLVFILDVSPRKGLERATHKNRFENEGLAFHKAVRAAYLSLARRYKWRIIEGGKPVHKVQEEIYQAVIQRLR